MSPHRDADEDRLDRLTVSCSMETVQHYLPEWALWSQFALTALTSGATSGAVVFYGLWQLKLSREKLRHDLYSKRYEIYHSAQDILGKYWRGTVTQNDISDAALSFGQARFLLDWSADQKLDRMHQLIFKVFVFDNGQKPRLEGPGADERFRQNAEDRMQITAISQELPAIFEPYLRLRDFSRPQVASNLNE